MESTESTDEQRQEEDWQLSYWLLPTVFYVIHGIAVCLFGASNADLTGPDADAGGMVWIAWILIDFPIGIAAVSIGEEASTNAMGVLLVALIGGIQWILWGLIATWISRGITRRKH